MKSISENNLSTRTIVADCNIQFDHVRIFEELPVNYKLNNYLCKIIAMYHKDCPKGDLTYLKTKKKLSSFRNAVNIIINDDENNFFNIKLSDKGKFQISGAKNLEKTYYAMMYLISLIKTVCPYCIMNHQDEIVISFTTVMTNFVYNAGFKIDKEKLNRLLIKDESHKFYNLFETSVGYTGLNLKLKMNPNDFQVKIPVFKLKNEKWRREEKEYQKLGKFEKFNSFLVFHSGKIICSGMTENTMNEAFLTFRNYIKQHKDEIIESIKI